MNKPLLELAGVACERDEELLFAPVNLQLAAGDIVQVAGANGVGKTSLLRAICGLSSRFVGEIRWRGETWPRCRTRLRDELLYLGHSAGLKAALTPRDNLRWWCALRGGDQTAIDTALERVGLAGYEEQPCYSLSAGQQRRVGLARLFLINVSLWVLDEPLTAIDRSGVAALENWLAEHCSQGGAVLITTHQPLAQVTARELLLT